jgi:thymidine kinase
MTDQSDDRGELLVYTGPMWAGKSTALIDTLQEYDTFLAVTPERDDRGDGIETHDGDGISAWPVPEERPADVYDRVTDSDPDAVGIDEAQFFDNSLVATVDRLRAAGYDVVIAGLDCDFRREPFAPVPQLVDTADTVEQLYAQCTVCDEAAAYSQRLIAGDPAPYDSPQVLSGEELYEARCGEHHVVPGVDR